MHDLFNTLRETMASLLPPGSRVIVAASGGPDSQALLDIMARLRHDLGWDALTAVGIDHGLRPEAAAELDKARQLALSHGLTFRAVKVQLSGRGNILQQARRARYAALHRCATELRAHAIALAHHATDQVETILQHLSRGCGLRGARGMRPGHGLLVRPLLHVSQQHLSAYVAARRLAYAQDPSNVHPQRARTQLRQAVLPTLEKLNTRYAEHFAEFAERARADEAYLAKVARRRLPRLLGPYPATLKMTELCRIPSAIGVRVLQHWLQLHKVVLHQTTLASLWAARSQPSFVVATRQFHLRLERGLLWFGEAPSCPSQSVVVPGKIDLPVFGAVLAATEQVIKHGGARQFTLAGVESVAFDADRLHFGLKVRPWQPADKLRPFGLNGHTKVSDLFTNAKIPRALRSVWPVISHGDTILWVVGLRRGSEAPVEPGTRRIVTLQIVGKLAGALPWSAC